MSFFSFAENNYIFFTVIYIIDSSRIRIKKVAILIPLNI